MSNPFKLRSVLTLAISLLGGGLILLVILTVGTAGQRRLSEQVGASVMLQADQMQDKLDRALYERVREIDNTSDVLDGITNARGAEGLRMWLDAIQASYPDYAWIGLADTKGIVQTATRAQLEGDNLAGEAWFQNGLSRQAVSDVGDFPMLSKSLASSSGPKHRYVAISAPVKDRSGATVGVLCALLDWSWIDEVRDSLFGKTASRTEQVIVLDKSGIVILGPPDVAGRQLDLASVKSVVEGVPLYAIERWPDGRDYVTGVSRSDGYRSFAGLGWIVTVRQDADVALAPVQRLQRQTMAWGLALAALGALAAWLVSRRISSPLLRLANSADAIRTGDEVHIPNVADYAEVKVLSRSLDTLVSELKRRQDALAELNVSLEAQVADRTSELVRRNEALTSAREHAEAATASKSRFLAAASHDLRQPLHAMTLFARALSRRVSGAEAPKLVEQLELSLVSLKQMFDSLLDMSRLDAGLIEPHFASISVRETVERISQAFDAEAQARGLTFKWRTMDGVIVTDPALFETMLRNLIANSLKFTRSGWILLAAHRHQGRIAFEVWDTGAGIAPDQQMRVFGEFERAQLDASGTNEGLGLGLSIVKRYADLLGIDIRLVSKPGRGTAFTLLLPDRKSDVSIPLPSHIEDTTLLPGVHVLLIDDDPLILSAMHRELTDRGCVATCFASGSEAEAALSAGLRVDVAIVDFNLGAGLTGISALAGLERTHGAMPALLITGGTDAETLSAVAASGRPWLIKPADPEAVARRLKELVAPQHGD